MEFTEGMKTLSSQSAGAWQYFSGHFGSWLAKETLIIRRLKINTMINGENFLSGKNLIKNLTNWQLINSLLPSASHVSFFSSAISVR
jgi:hypothetical protein